MPQLLLNDVQQMAFVRQFKGMGMTEPVGVDPLFYADLSGEPLEQVPHIRRPEWFPLQGAE